MTITETRHINFSDLYHLCVERDWYTCGTNAEYELMFGKAKGDMTTEKMVALAKDIIEHSAPTRFDGCEENGTTPLAYVLYELSEIAHTTFEGV